MHHKDKEIKNITTETKGQIEKLRYPQKEDLEDEGGQIWYSSESKLDKLNISTKDLYKHIHNSFIHNSPKLETAQVAHPYNAMLIKNKGTYY